MVCSVGCESWWEHRAAVLLRGRDTVTSLLLHGSHSSTGKTWSFMIPTEWLRLLCTIDYFSSFFLPSACEWNVVGVEPQHRKAECSDAWTLSVEAWKLGLHWYGSSTLHAATVGFIWTLSGFANACQTLSLVIFIIFSFVQTYPTTFHSSSSNSQQLLLASAGQETLHEEIQQVHIFSLGVHCWTCFKNIGWKAWNLWNDPKPN